MGNTSERQIIIEDEEGQSVVNVTDSVVRRLRGLPEHIHKDKTEDSGRSIENTSKRPPITYTVDNEKILRELEERNQKMLKMSTQEFARAVEEVEKKFMKTSGSPVCQDLQEQVYQCYHSNPKQTLNCSKQVRAFSACVETARQNALTRRS